MVATYCIIQKSGYYRSVGFLNECKSARYTISFNTRDSTSIQDKWEQVNVNLFSTNQKY
ncbi:hypothetical protein FHR29_005307 [Sphingobacterium sp. JUb56]|nr:hypothetical protein [Sphingobacterium sp. JUb56]